MTLAGEMSRVPEVLAAERVEHVRYAIRDIAVEAERLVRQGKEIIPLHIGDPLNFDFRTPPHLIEAVTRAIRDGKNGYAPSLGLDEALDAIRAEAGRKGILNIQTVFVTYGVSEAADICLTGLVNRGENVLVPCPDYPLYSAILTKLEARVNFYRLDESRGWEPDLEDLARKVDKRTRALIVINPNNPTGAVYSRETLEKLAEFARQHRLVIITDEIYDKLILDGEPHHALASLAPDLPVVTLKGLSKVYLVPGWRVGWAMVSGPEAVTRGYIENLQKLVRARLSANFPMQFAIRPALEGPQGHVREAVEKLRARRDLTMRWAESAPGVQCAPPRGAFYAFPRFEISGSDEAFARQLLVKQQVLIVHGSGFGMEEGNPHFRIVFLADEARLLKAYGAISDFLRERAQLK